MDYSELVKALRCCATMTCKGDECKYMILGCHDCFPKLHDDAAAAIEELQAQLPKRGEWIFDGKFMELHKFRCSNCKRTEFRMSDYCPNCGADMRKMEVQDDKA